MSEIADNVDCGHVILAVTMAQNAELVFASFEDVDSKST